MQFLPLAKLYAASTELLVRRHAARFLRGEALYETHGRVGSFIYPAWGVGPPRLNWIKGRPSLFRALPTKIRDPLARRAIRPAGAAWLRPRLEGVRITTDRTAQSVSASGAHVSVRLSDGEERPVDQVVLATGYRIDVRRLDFLDRNLSQSIRKAGGYPGLSAPYESSVPGLYFGGAPAAASAGPGMRFVSHTGFTAAALTNRVLRAR